MSKLATRLSTLALSATTLLAIPAMAITSAEASGHHKKHHHGAYYAPGRGWAAGEMQPVYQQAGPVCPAIGKSFDCKIWPPPYADDPDRKTSKF
jgi:hypothetical protein